jgi:hypothetical protein
MSHCPAIVLAGISPEKYQQLLVTAQSQGLALIGESGSTVYQGMDFTWAYDAPAQSLTIECVAKPIFIPSSMIESRIRALILAPDHAPAQPITP